MMKKGEFTNAQSILKAKIMSKMGCIVGAQAKFSEMTGFDYMTIRKWVSSATIPFIFAEVIALWLEVDVVEMMNWGVKITPQVRLSGIYRDEDKHVLLRVPSQEAAKDDYVGLLAAALIPKGYMLCNPENNMPVLDPSFDLHRCILIFGVLRSIALRKIINHEKRGGEIRNPPRAEIKVVFRTSVQG